MRKRRKFRSQNRTTPKKRFNKQLIWGTVIAGIMLLSSAGFYYGGGIEDSQNYQDYILIQQNGKWQVKDLNAQFDYHPATVIDIGLEQEVFDTLRAHPTWYMTFDPDGKYLQDIDYVRFEISQTLFDEFRIYLQSAKTVESDTYTTLPVITCENASINQQVIVLKASNNKNITYVDNCLTVMGGPADFTRFKDHILYKLYGII
ncbi:hypothetical protein GOV04_05685 [Candidatus Woesearchaeota archaeon]|nr:hypothetical protein [Candidatus Woesearchaeota archaeon]